MVSLDNKFFVICVVRTYLQLKYNQTLKYAYLYFVATQEVPLTITTSPYTVEVDSGQEISLACNAVGTLAPTIAWTSPSGDVILTGQQFTFDQMTGEIIL